MIRRGGAALRIVSAIRRSGEQVGLAKNLSHRRVPFIYSYCSRRAMAANPSIEDIETRFPIKVELHCHLDGAVRPETVLDIARDRGMLTQLPHKTVDELNDDVILKGPCSLQRFLKSFAHFMPIINGDKAALTRIAHEICEDCAKQNIKYMEVRYAPHLFANCMDNHEYATTIGNVTPHDVVQTICDALARGSRKWDVTVKSILCCITHRPEWSADVLKLCQDFKDQGVVGMDLAGEEFSPGGCHIAKRHKRVFKRAKELGIHRTVHAGEVGPAEAVKEALDDMYAERIGHGYHSLDDITIYQRVLEDQVHLEVCPISSIYTRACNEDISKHPLIQFAKDGINFSINSDDPIVLGNTISHDYQLSQRMGLSDDDIIRGIFNAARACFAPEAEKKRLLKELTDIYGEQ